MSIDSIIKRHDEKLQAVGRDIAVDIRQVIITRLHLLNSVLGQGVITSLITGRGTWRLNGKQVLVTYDGHQNLEDVQDLTYYGAESCNETVNGVPLKTIQPVLREIREICEFATTNAYISDIEIDLNKIAVKKQFKQK